MIENLSHRGCTQVIVAHRLSAIRDADLILVMDQGQVVQQGRHETLMEVLTDPTQLLQKALKTQQHEPRFSSQHIVKYDLKKYAVHDAKIQTDKQPADRQLSFAKTKPSPITEFNTALPERSQQPTHKRVKR